MHMVYVCVYEYIVDNMLDKFSDERISVIILPGGLYFIP